MVFKGTTSTSATSTAANIPSYITSFSIANKTGGTITASVLIYYGSTGAYILYAYNISTNSAFIYTGDRITVQANYSIVVSVSGSADYYFSIE